MFSSSNIEKLFPIFDDVGLSISEKLDQFAGKGPLDSKDIIADNILQGATETILGRKSSTSIDELITNAKHLIEWTGVVMMIRAFNPIYYSNTLFKLCNYNIINEALRRISSTFSFISQVIQDYKFSEERGTLPDWISLIDVWNKATSGTFEDAHWNYEVFTLIGAATDTTVSSIYFLLVTLAAHPEVQDKVYSEIKEVMGSREGGLTISDLTSMTYLGHAITESMRLHGVVPLIGRVATRDTQLSNFTLPAGCDVMMLLQAMGWDPDVFPEPHKYIPERFMAIENNEGSDTLSSKFMPFSGGPRNCLGKNYATLLIKCIIVRILCKFKLATAVNLDDIKLRINMVVFSKQPLLIDFQAR